MSLDIRELRKKDEGQLQKLLEKTRGKLEKSFVDVMQGKSKNTSKAKRLRKDIARIMTILSENKVKKEKK